MTRLVVQKVAAECPKANTTAPHNIDEGGSCVIQSTQVGANKHDDGKLLICHSSLQPYVPESTPLDASQQGISAFGVRARFRRRLGIAKWRSPLSPFNVLTPRNQQEMRCTTAVLHTPSGYSLLIIWQTFIVAKYCLRTHLVLEISVVILQHEHAIWAVTNIEKIWQAWLLVCSPMQTYWGLVSSVR
jgi:hypothetical protein